LVRYAGREPRIDVGIDDGLIVDAEFHAELRDDTCPGRRQQFVALLAGRRIAAEQRRIVDARRIVVNPALVLASRHIANRRLAGIADRDDALLYQRRGRGIAAERQERTDVAACLHHKIARSRDLKAAGVEEAAIADVAASADRADHASADVLHDQVEI